MKKILHIGGRVLLATGLLCLLLAACCYSSLSHFRRHAAIASGTVIDMVSNRDAGNLIYAPVITFQDHQGCRHTYISGSFAPPANYSIGEQVNVYFDPESPAETAQLGGVNLHLYAMVLLYLGLLAGCLGALALAYERWGWGMPVRGRFSRADPQTGKAGKPASRSSRKHAYCSL
ncbi:DUF3592 domain-containing protein [Chitinophaga parva]|nr:DUF3592 domain-containing protein [Chitinophaga parva]